MRKVGVLIAGLGGSVATTAITGIAAINAGLVDRLGMTTIEIEKTVPLVPLEGLVFGGWDLKEVDLFTSAVIHEVVNPFLLEKVQPMLQSIRAMQGLSNSEEMIGKTAQDLIEDISAFKKANPADDYVVVDLCSTSPMPMTEIWDMSLADFEEAIKTKSPLISAGMLYAYAALKTDCPYLNFTPNVTVEIPALQELLEQKGLCAAGKDGKTGQTLYKTVLAPMLKARNLRLEGWFSTNILGNNDGLFLKDQINRETKIASKIGVLDKMLGYSDFRHIVEINYYEPKGDAKEAWDSVDFKGWLGEKMSMKINWQGKDSILAAPLVIDLIRLVDYAHSQKETGFLDYLAMFFKSPYDTEEHDFFAQRALLDAYVEQEQKNTMRAEVEVV